MLWVTVSRALTDTAESVCLLSTQWKNTTSSTGRSDGIGSWAEAGQQHGGQRRGPWHLAKGKALSVGLSNAYFKSLGLPTLIDGC
jgi:RNA-directed DNA polymerase